MNHGHLRRLRLALLPLVPLVLPSLLVACGGEKSTAPPWATAGTATDPTTAGGAQAPVAGQAVTPEDPARSSLLKELRSRKFKNEDFVESEANRDPFRCFLSDFSGGPKMETRQYEIVLSKFSLDELKLSMITSPRGGSGASPFKRQKNDPDCDLRPCAVFVDGTGLGVPVSRNFHISKADAKVVRIDPDKGQVYVEIKEDLGNGKFRMVERVLEMHQSGSGEGGQNQ